LPDTVSSLGAAATCPCKCQHATGFTASGVDDFGDGLRSALPRLEAALGLVDDEDSALAPHEAVVAVTCEQ